MSTTPSLPAPSTAAAPRRRRSSALVALALVLALAVVASACGDDGDGGDDAGGSGADGDTDVTVSDVWARTSPAAQANGAVYLVVTGGSVDDALVGVSVPASVAARAELHETALDDASDDASGDDTASGGGSSPDGGTEVGTDGEMSSEGSSSMGGEGSGTTAMAGAMMTMREVAEIPIPAGTEVRLEPGGYHVMLLELAAPLEVGQEVPVTLTFAEAGTVEVTAEVREG